MPDIEYERQSPFEDLRNPEFKKEVALQADEAEPSSKLLEAREASRNAGQQLREVRKREQDEEGEMPLPERCKSVDVELADGTVIGMALPNIAVQIMAQKILSKSTFEDQKLMSYALTQVRAVLHIESMNGEPVARPTNEIEYKILVNKLGDVGLEAVMTAFMECFPPVQQNEFKIVKKS